jgi:hypothetical protein
MKISLNSYPTNIIKEFDYEKNKPLIPEHFSVSSGKKVWWICFKKYEWQSEIAWRSSGQNCPQCYRERPRKR